MVTHAADSDSNINTEGVRKLLGVWNRTHLVLESKPSACLF